MKNRVLLIGMPLLFLSGELDAETVKPEAIVAHFGNTPVHAEELALHLRDEVALVAVHFQTTYGVALANKDWRRSFGGEVPLQLLQQRALDSCHAAKAIQSLAVEKGIAEALPFPGYAAYCANLNRSRAAAKARGRILYGPLEYSPLQLYKYQLGNMRNHLREALSKEGYERREALLRSSIKKRREAMPIRTDAAKVDEIAAAQVGADSGVKQSSTQVDAPPV